VLQPIERREELHSVPCSLPNDDYRFCCGHATEPKARARDRLQQPAVGQPRYSV